VPVLGVAVLSSVAFSGIAYAATPQAATAPAQPSADKPATDSSSGSSSADNSSSSAPSNPLDIVLNVLKPVLALVQGLPDQLLGALGTSGSSSSDNSTTTTTSGSSAGTAKTEVAIPEGTQVIAACQEPSADAYTVHAALPQAVSGLLEGASIQLDSSALTGLAGQAVPNVPMCASSDSMISNS